MGSSGPPTLDGGAQSISLALLRSNSSLSGGSQSNPMHSQQQFSNLVSPRTQFNCNNDNNSMNILGNIPNVSSLMNQSMGNGANLRQLGSAEPDPLSMNQQFSVQQQQQQQVRGVLGNVGQMDQNGSIRNMSPKRGLGPVKLEQQHSDPSMFLQQQQMLQMPRQNPQAALQNLLQQQQQRLMQQQILKGLPQLAQLQQQQQLQLNLPLRSQLKTNSYEPGLCARRLTLYICEQKRRPEDNDVNFWRNFVSEFFAPNAKKRWCVSFYGTGRQTTGVFPQDVWHCEICKRKPGRGFETTAEVLPRLCSIKYDSGTLEELLYVDMPHETQLPTGQIVLDYPKAIQESVFEQLRVVRDGHLRIIFNSDLKISSWEFCARKHEELIPRRLIIPQMSQLGALVQKYQNAVQNASSGLSTQDLQNSCNSFVASACHVAKSLEVPLVNDLGYTKRYVRCLQISEVVNSMKDLMDYSRETGTGPMQSLINFPRKNFNLGLHPQQEVQQPQEQHQAIAQNSNPRQEPQQPQEQHHAIAQNSIPKQEFQQPQEQHQAIAQNSNHNDPNSTQANIMQLPSCNNDIGTVSYSVNGPSLSTTPTAGLLQHQNSMNPRQSSSGSLHHSQHNPSSPFSSPTMQQQERQPTQPHEPDPSELIQEMMSLPSHNGAGLLGSNGMRGNPGLAPPMNVGGMEFGNMGGAGPTTAVNGLRVQMLHNAMGINGRVGMNRMPQNLMGTGMNLQLQQQDMGNRLLGGGMGSVNNYNYFHFN